MEAVKKALEKPERPLDCYWMCHPYAPDEIRAYVSWSERQVNLIIYTPLPTDFGVLGEAERSEAEPILAIEWDWNADQPGVRQLMHRP
jgi:hypothetical protein